MSRMPHDSLFRATFGRPADAASQLGALLNERQKSALDLDRIRPVAAAFIDPELRSSTPDLLFAVPQRGGGEAHALFLLEHQSRSDPRMPFRFAR
jgi:predicted transposase YdaD